MIEEPITNFYVFQSNTARQVVVAIPINDVIFRCWSTNNDITSILKTVQFLFANHRFGWSSTADSLGPLIATYSIESHPEYFL